MDAYLAMTVAVRLPGAGLWDPTNMPGSWDHTLLAAGKTVLFETKGNEARSNNIAIDLDQLRAYLSLGVAPLVFYVFADPPGWNDARLAEAPGFPAWTWPSFGDWGYVVPAATLARAIGLAGMTRTIRPNAGTFEVAASGATVPSVQLGRFLDELKECRWIRPHPGAGAPVLPGDPGPERAEMLIGDIGSLGEFGQPPSEPEPERDRLLTALALFLPA